MQTLHVGDRLVADFKPPAHEASQLEKGKPEPPATVFVALDEAVFGKIPQEPMRGGHVDVRLLGNFMHRVGITARGKQKEDLADSLKNLDLLEFFFCNHTLNF